MTSRWNESAEVWMRMVQRGTARWNKALELAEKADKPNEKFSSDEFMGNAVAGWAQMIKSWSELTDVWLGAAPSEKEIPTIGFVVDSVASGEVEDVLDLSVPKNARIVSTDLISMEDGTARIPSADVTVDVLADSIRLRVKINAVKPGQYLGMLYQLAQGGRPPAIASVHLVRLSGNAS